MQYQGGKRQIARHLAPLILSENRPVWEPFVGGGNMVPYLNTRYASDANVALITMYQALGRGWLPPEWVSRDEYYAARDLPDTDPLKAWAGFACSFGGKWFGGYGSSKVDVKHPHGHVQVGSRLQLLKQLSKLAGAEYNCVSFLDVLPESLPVCIYADPPYAGTLAYSATAAFDTSRFWSLVQQWEAQNVPVYVSEYACPVPHRVVWEGRKQKSIQLDQAQHATERLFRVLV